MGYLARGIYRGVFFGCIWPIFDPPINTPCEVWLRYYVWECKMYGKWIRRSIIDYIDSNKAYSHLRFWIPVWSKEYNKRINAIEMIRMRQETASWSEAINILDRDYLKRSEKVRRIYKLLSDITKKEVAELTGVSYVQVKRILKDE